MKSCVLVLCVVLLIVTNVSTKKNGNNDEGKGKTLKKAFKECQKNEETRVDGVVLKKLRKHKQVDLPDNFGDHKLCVLKGVGYINEDDTINEDTLKKKITKKAKPGQSVDDILAECKEAKATPKETAINIETCLNKNGLDL